jgi:ankyrin repeat protein
LIVRDPLSEASDDPRAAFLVAATWHGTLERAEAILAAHRELASGDVHTAAVLGDAAAVRSFLARDRANATVKSAPYGADALVYLCLSKYLRLDPRRSDDFLSAAEALLDAGAHPGSGFWTTGQYPEFETALYGAAGVAHHPGLTALLLERGADPNDEEAVYHSPETDDNRAMQLLVETGQVTASNLAMMLIRKHDWHDLEGVRYLLERGADPNLGLRGRELTALHHAIARDNSLAIIELLLDHGADAKRLAEGISAVAGAARRGRGDLLELFELRGVPTEPHGEIGLLAACARHDATRVEAIASSEPGTVRAMLESGGARLAEFAGNWNTEGVRHLLDLGVPVAALYDGDPYFGIARDSTALHVAAWKGVASTVQLLIARGASVNAADGAGRTPLVLAVKACVDSYWTERRTPESVRALLAAGASVDGVRYPSGYAEVDALLRRSGAGETP